LRFFLGDASAVKCSNIKLNAYHYPYNNDGRSLDTEGNGSPLNLQLASIMATKRADLACILSAISEREDIRAARAVMIPKWKTASREQSVPVPYFKERNPPLKIAPLLKFHLQALPGVPEKGFPLAKPARLHRDIAPAISISQKPQNAAIRRNISMIGSSVSNVARSSIPILRKAANYPHILPNSVPTHYSNAEYRNVIKLEGYRDIQGQHQVHSQLRSELSRQTIQVSAAFPSHLGRTGLKSLRIKFPSYMHPSSNVTKNGTFSTSSRKYECQISNEHSNAMTKIRELLKMKSVPGVAKRQRNRSDHRGESLNSCDVTQSSYVTTHHRGSQGEEEQVAEAAV
jgi:hypothetical protein